MKIKIKSLFIVSICFCLVLVMLMVGCWQAPSQPEPTAPPAATGAETTPTPVQKPSPEAASTPKLPTAVSAPTGPMKAQLSFSDLPLIGKPVQLTATLSIWEGINKDIPDTSVELILPEGFELVGGNLAGTVDVMWDSPAQLQATVKAVKTGYWQIQVRAEYDDPAAVGGKFGTRVDLYANISEETAEVSDVPIWPKLPEPRGKDVPPAKMPLPNPPRSSSLSPPLGKEDEVWLKVCGGVYCNISENNLPTSDEPRDDVTVPMVWVLVKVYSPPLCPP